MSDLTKRRIGRSLFGLLGLTTLTVGVVQLATTAHLSGWILLLLLATTATMIGLRAAGWLSAMPGSK